MAGRVVGEPVPSGDEQQDEGASSQCEPVGRDRLGPWPELSESATLLTPQVPKSGPARTNGAMPLWALSS